MTVRLLCLCLLALMLTACMGRLPAKRSLNNFAHGYTIVSSPVRAGEEAQRFEVRAGDCGESGGWSDCATDRERSELSVTRRWRHGADMWIGYSIFVPDDYQTSHKVRTTAGQIHQTGGPSGQYNNLPSFPPMMQMEMQGNRYFAKVHVLTGDRNNVNDSVRRFDLTTIDAMRGKWTDVAIHFDTKSTPERLSVFINGKMMADMVDWITFIPDEYYFKYGVYRTSVSREGGPMPTQILFYDEVKMGSDQAEVMVNPDQPVD